MHPAREGKRAKQRGRVHDAPRWVVEDKTYETYFSGRPQMDGTGAGVSGMKPSSSVSSVSSSLRCVLRCCGSW